MIHFLPSFSARALSLSPPANSIFARSPGRAWLPRALLLLFTTFPLSAQVTFTPATGSWFTAANWSDSIVPTDASTVTIGHNTTAHSVTIAGGEAFADSLTVGNSTTAAGSGAVTVDTDGVLTANYLEVGTRRAGTVNVQNGGRVTVTSFLLGSESNGTGTLNISGADTLFTSTGTNDMVGWSGTGIINVSDGATLANASALTEIGYDNGAKTSTVTITSGAQWQAGTITLGIFGGGTLHITAGGSVTSGAVDLAFGNVDGPNVTRGTALVTGSDSIWTITGDLKMGAYLDESSYNTALLTVADGATVTVSGNIDLDRRATIAIGSGGLAGTLTAAAINLTSMDPASPAGAHETNPIIAFNHTNDLVFSSRIASAEGDPYRGYGQLTKAGSGTLTLTGLSNYSGATTITGGVLSVSTIKNGATENDYESATFDSNIGASTNAAANLVLNGGTLKYTGATQTTNRRFTVGPSGGGLDASGTGAISFTGSGSLSLSGTGDRTLTLTGSNTAANTLGFSVGSPTSGTLAIAKTGSGLWVLSKANTFTGGVIISDGTLRASNATALGAATNTVTLSGTGTLALNSNVTIGALNGTAGSVTLGSNSLTVGSTNHLASSFAGAISGTGSLIKAGAGTLTLSGTNSYTGTTTVNNGTLQLGSSSALPSAAMIVATHTAGGIATLDLNHFNATITTLSLGGATGASTTSAAHVSTGTGKLTLGGNVTFTATNNPLGSTISGNLGLGSSTRTFTVGDSTTTTADLTISAAITGSGGLTKAGVGTLVLSGDNAYTGTTTLGANTGTVIITRNNALGTTAGPTSVANGATLAFSGGFDYTTAETLNLSTSTTGSLSNLSGTNSFAGNISVNGLSRIIVASASALTLSGAITGSPQISLSGGGTLTLSNSSNNFSGSLSFGTHTTVIATADHALGHTSSGSVNVNNTGTLAFAGGVNYTSGKNVTLVGNGASGRNGAIDNLSGDNTFAGSITISDPVARIGATANTQLTLTGGISSALSGWGLTIAGPGTIELSGDNTYSGATAVSGGTLLVNNVDGTSATGSSTVTIAAGATLGGSGFISGATTVHGTLSPGNSPGVLTFASDLTLAPDSFTLIQLGGLLRGSEHDGVTVGGTLTFGGTLNLSLFNGFVPTAGHSFDIFDWSTGALGSFQTVILPTLDGFAWNIDALYTTGTVSLNAVSAIPEPSTYAVLFGACTLAFALRRRRASL